MKEDYKELVEYLDEKFNKIDGRFNTLPEVFVTKDEFNSAINLLSTKEDLNNLMTAVDAYAKKADAFFQELVMLSRKVDRHEKWLLQIAEKLGIKLEY